MPRPVAGASDDFYHGVIWALMVLHQAGEDTLYREIAGGVNTERLVRVARRNGDLRLSGLTRHGYGRTPAPAQETER